MKLRTRQNIAAFVVLAALSLCHVALAADAPQSPWVRPDGSVDYQKLPRKPQPGDKLGYPKEQSAQMLPPDIRVFLDGVLQLYTVNGLFLDASRTYELLGTQPTRMEMLRENGRIVGYTVKLAPSGVFGRVYARSISPNTPGVALSFSSGCLSRIDLRMPLQGQEEVSLALAGTEQTPVGLG